MTDRSKTVVMLIDWDNLQICHSRDAPGTELDLQALIALAQSYGTLVSARAYAEWNLLTERLAVYKAGIEPVFAPVMRPEGSPREGKSLADTVMVADGVDLLWTVAPDVFVLATSDKDMIPLARIAKQRGAAVVVLGSDLTAIPLVEMSNVFITYRQLLRELDRVSELEAPVGRAPARERRLRENRRPSSEPYGGLGGNAISAGPIGSTSRTGMRPVGLSAPPVSPVPLQPSRPPRRRFEEPLAPPVIPEPERPLPMPMPVSTSPLVADTLSDEATSATGELGTRRRRRRGGRGRRTGLGSVGDADMQAETLQDTLDDTDEGDGTEDERSSAVGSVASPASPDDIDNAVLQLLASRDREGVTPEVRRESVSSPAPSSSFSTPTTEPESESASPAPRRVARTSFSSFGPPDPPIQRVVPPSVSSEPTEVVSETEAPAEPDSSARDLSAVIHDIAPDAVMPESVSAEPVANEPFPQFAPVSEAESLVTAETPVDSEAAVASTASESDEVQAADVQAAEVPATAGAAPAERPARTTRSGSVRRTRRPASSGEGASNATGRSEDAGAEGTSSSDDEPARAPRRRRVRRPAPATSGESGDVTSSEAGA